MRIPKKFHLHGRTYRVKVIPESKWSEKDAVAYFHPERDEIHVKQQSQQAMEHCFLHEMVHAIFNALNEDELYANEKLVDNLAALLHQALTSAR